MNKPRTDNYDWDYLLLGPVQRRQAVAAHLRSRGLTVDEADSSTLGAQRLDAAMRAIFWVSEREGEHPVTTPERGEVTAVSLVARHRLGRFVGPSRAQQDAWDAQAYHEAHSPEDHIPSFRPGAAR